MCRPAAAKSCRQGWRWRRRPPGTRRCAAAAETPARRRAPGTAVRGRWRRRRRYAAAAISTSDVDRRLQDGLHVGARQPAAHQNDAAEAETQIKDGGAKEQLRRIDGEAARAAQRIQAEQHQRHQDPIQIEDAEHAPIQWRDLGSMLRSNWRFKLLSLLCFALSLSLIQNSAPYATGSALKDNS